MFQSTPVFSLDGRAIGHVRGGRLELRRKGSKHMLRNPLAWAVDKGAIERAAKAGANMVHILDTESKKEYLIEVSTMKARGWIIDRGFGAQLALILSEWRDPNQPEQPALF